MTQDYDESVDRLVYELKERAKELNCLYEVQALLNNPDNELEDIFSGLVKVIPPGWQYPDICQTKIIFGERAFHQPDFSPTPWVQKANIVVQDNVVGEVSVYYMDERPVIDEGPFLREERRLINTIADQLGNHLLQHRLNEVFEKRINGDRDRQRGWRVVLTLLRRTDPSLLLRVSRKMINYLCWSGVRRAEDLLHYFSPAYAEDRELLEVNYPYQIKAQSDVLTVSDKVFELADEHLSEDDILGHIQQWIREDQSSFLINTLVGPGVSLTEISSAVERYHHLASQGLELSESREKSVKAGLIRRLVSDDPVYVEIAKQFSDVRDFKSLLDRMIFPAGSHGKLGGKGAGIFLATQILKKTSQENELLRPIKTPKTWYLASDTIFYFVRSNGLEDIVEHKYLDIAQVRQEYPYVVHVFKNSPLPSEIVKDLSLALDDLGDVPLIVRSSSILEDQVGMSFAGKYKSLFIANQGSKEKRLEELIDAIAEVYASMFGPDPIEYRSEHGLIDHHEEMGILIQEVVGTKVGPYFFPAYAGVAFSNNEFRWSSRIKREDGLVRVVPGLGTRAVDRTSDDFPILAAPGQPGLRVNVSPDEVVRYSPKMIDVINLEKKTFETIEIRSLLQNFGRQYPDIRQLISIVSHDSIRQPLSTAINFEQENTVISFDGLFSRTPFLKQMHTLLNVLQDNFGHPVDIEFACDGTDFYLLQCRSQSYREDSKPAIIPNDVDPKKILFTANRHISNGYVPDISYIVYVDPHQYRQLSDRQEMVNVGRAVGRLNKILPRRQFVLIGPGRWGSRGDIKLGVSVTYSDINNTAMLIEMACKNGDYLPELSFGTHFFQDLVEASIRYLPLYPDDENIIFNQDFFLNAKNNLTTLLPDFAHLADVLRVIDIPQVADGRVMQILMNADQVEALALLAEPEKPAIG